ncbi:hypothetical protein [Paenibacillus xerothermodurans]|uniref:Uncharacterized protein n=1 Tax=Paenibacillus xerothermodurans TaxID=1977292 RepID=A0A2W1NCX7_PAEXE|nr:hypothetical protein [Paenibacillus xerothermodurans]PZE21510.1 hypothetical protein CBW46_009245 [Paenibacillus xerothermodurans]
MDLKKKVSVLALGAALMLPSVVGAAPATDPMNTPNVETAPNPATAQMTGETNIRGIYVPGNFIVNEDTRIAYILGGIGLVVVDKSTALPANSYYIN